MKRIGKSIICIIAAIAALTSCKKDDTLCYNNFTMGNVVEGTFTSDQGNIFTVVEKNCSENIETMKRAVVLCDVLRKVEGSENNYEVRLNACKEVLTKAPVAKTVADENIDMAVEDPINIAELWIAGGYINMYLTFEAVPGSKTKHLVNLVIDEEASTGGNYVFTLRHNSYGESLSHGAEDISLGGSYVSFPIHELITENIAEITFNWKWYKSAGQGWSSEIQDNSHKIIYSKGGYEHQPNKLASKITNNLN